MNPSIDLNKIRSPKALEAMRTVLTDFINFDPAVIKALYEEDYGWGEEDYEADIEESKELLERVERRMKSLGRHLSKVKVEKSQPQTLEKAEQLVATVAV